MCDLSTEALVASTGEQCLCCQSLPCMGCKISLLSWQSKPWCGLKHNVGEVESTRDGESKQCCQSD